ncbi:hypothetical protein [Ruminiclostridium hungatei]
MTSRQSIEIPHIKLEEKLQILPRFSNQG